MDITHQISKLLAARAMENWNDTGNSWRWSADSLKDLQLELAEILKALPTNEAMLDALEKAWVIEGCVHEAYSSDEAQYSCANMDVDQDGFRRGVLSLRNDYLELIENDDPGEYADDDTILSMDLDSDSIDFPFGQEYEVQKRDAYNFLSKIGAEPEEVMG